MSLASQRVHLRQIQQRELFMNAMIERLDRLKCIVRIRAYDRTTLNVSVFASQHEIDCFLHQHGGMEVRWSEEGQYWFNAAKSDLWASVIVRAGK